MLKITLFARSTVGLNEPNLRVDGLRRRLSEEMFCFSMMRMHCVTVINGIPAQKSDSLMAWLGEKRKTEFS